MKCLLKGLSARPILVLSLFAFFALPIMHVWAAKGDLVSIHSSESSLRAPIQLTLGKAELLSMPGMVSDVLVAHPSVVNVQAVQSDR